MIIDSSQEAVQQAAMASASATNKPSGQTTIAPQVSAKTGASQVGYRQIQNAKVQVLNGKFAGREVELNKALTTLGSPGAQVIAITKRNEGYFIVMVENKRADGAPSVNGAPLGSQAVKLDDNDVIEIIGIKMGFFAS
jgi:hypothetical protein